MATNEQAVNNLLVTKVDARSPRFQHNEHTMAAMVAELRNQERVIEAAREVLAELGTDATVEQIASRAGVGVGTVYRHFPTKDALVDELVTQIIDTLIASADIELAKVGKAQAQCSYYYRHGSATQMFENPKKSWHFNQSPLFLQFLMGKRDFECTPWGNPTYNVFGWQKPCYLLQDGYAQSFQELMETTEWSKYGRKSQNPKCQDCMVHCGFEPSAVRAAFESPAAMGATAVAMVTGKL